MLLVVLLVAGCAAPAPTDDDDVGNECRPTEPPGAAYAFGLVADAAGVPLDGATVTASAAAHQHETQVSTDGRGCYAIDIPSGQAHSVSASKPGFQDQTEQDVVILAGESEKINFRLEPA